MQRPPPADSRPSPRRRHRRAGRTTNSARLVRAGELQPAAPRRLRRRGPPSRPQAARHRLLVRATMAGLRRPAVVSHQSAAVLHGLPLWDVPLDRVHVTRRPRAWNDTQRRPVLPRRAAPGRRGDGGRRLAGHRLPSARRWTWPGRCPTRRPWSPSTRRCTPAPCRTTRCAGATVRHRGHTGQPERGARGRGSLTGGARASANPQPRDPAPLEAAAVGTAVRDPVGRTASLVGRTDFAWEADRLVGEFDGRIKYGRLLRPGQDARRRRLRGEAPGGRDPRRGLGRGPLGLGGPAAARTGWPRGSAARGSGRIARPLTRFRGVVRALGSLQRPHEREQHPRERAVRAGGPPASR